MSKRKISLYKLAAKDAKREMTEPFELPPTWERPISEEIETPVQETHDRVTFSTTFIEDVDLLAAHSLEYQQILALHSLIPLYRQSSFSQMKRSLLNTIDLHWDIYKKRFSIPDRLVCLQCTCAGGDFYLSLNNGYLCFYQYPRAKHRLALWLVKPVNKQKIGAN